MKIKGLKNKEAPIGMIRKGYFECGILVRRSVADSHVRGCGTEGPGNEFGGPPLQFGHCLSEPGIPCPTSWALREGLVPRYQGIFDPREDHGLYKLAHIAMGYL